MSNLENLRDAVVRAAVKDHLDSVAFGVTQSDLRQNSTEIALWNACEAYAKATEPPTVEEVLDAWDKSFDSIVFSGTGLVATFRARLEASKRGGE